MFCNRKKERTLLRNTLACVKKTEEKSSSSVRIISLTLSEMFLSLMFLFRLFVYRTFTELICEIHTFLVCLLLIYITSKVKHRLTISMETLVTHT